MKKLEIEQKLILTKEERRAWVVFDYITSRFAHLYGDKAQHALNIVGALMTTKRVEAAAKAMAKSAVHHMLTTICLEYPDKKELKNVTFRWIHTSCLTTCERVRVRYATPSMEIFYWSTKYHDTFKDAFIAQVSELLGECSCEVPHDIWASIWTFTLIND